MDWGETPLFRAKSSGMVQLLVKHGAQVDVTSRIGETPLLDAIQKQNVPVARALADRGACLTVRNVQGNTPLLRACQDDQSNMIFGLLSGNPSVLFQLPALLQQVE